MITTVLLVIVNVGSFGFGQVNYGAARTFDTISECNNYVINVAQQRGQDAELSFVNGAAAAQLKLKRSNQYAICTTEITEPKEN